ncbi:hypothetical protein [Arenibaculum pallidiluteum]|uniref:hypothetical protein n=1 Tax=Arenibaculum pallidiluteum TaxID=2812559 RepID=UPI001A97C65B|nr:hypothetical protein [Arenibaculum pallidiluteum]
MATEDLTELGETGVELPPGAVGRATPGNGHRMPAHRPGHGPHHLPLHVNGCA